MYENNTLTVFFLMTLFLSVDIPTVLLSVWICVQKIKINVHDLWIFLKKELCIAFHFASEHNILTLSP